MFSIVSKSVKNNSHANACIILMEENRKMETHVIKGRNRESTPISRFFPENGKRPTLW